MTLLKVLKFYWIGPLITVYPCNNLTGTSLAESLWQRPVVVPFLSWLELKAVNLTHLSFSFPSVKIQFATKTINIFSIRSHGVIRKSTFTLKIHIGPVNGQPKQNSQERYKNYKKCLYEKKSSICTILLVISRSVLRLSFETLQE